jgi:tetratricopeptide (TPR) repeat protein
MMLVSFLYPSKKKDSLPLENQEDGNSTIHYVAYVGIASFALMAIFNFIISAIPVLLLFCVYAGILCANSKQRILIELAIKPNIAKTVLLILTCTTFYITYEQLNQAKAHRQIKRAQDFLILGNFEDAENLLSPIQESLQNSVSFSMIYGNILYAQHKYKEALYQFNYAKKFSSNPMLYDMAGRCQFQLKDNKGAISNLYHLTALSPKTMKYKFGLMQVLLADKQIKQARRVAQEIVTMSIINANELTDKYLKEAKKVLKTQ